MQINMNWKAIKEDHLIKAIVLFFTICMMAIVFLFSNRITSLKIEIQSNLKKYERVSSLYHQIKICEGTRFYFNKDLLLVGKYIGGGLEEKIISIKPDPERPDGGVRIKFKGLTLNDLLEVFKFISSYNNIEVYGFLLKKDFVSLDLLDLDMGLRKNR